MRPPHKNPRLAFRQPEALVFGSGIQSLGPEAGETWLWTLLWLCNSGQALSLSEPPLVK